MNITTFLILAFVGMFSGMLGGIIGLGGGVIIIPALVMLLGMDQRMAQGTSIAVMLPPIGIMAVLTYYKAGYVNLPYAIVIAATFMIGGFFGARLAMWAPEQLIRRGFAVLLLVIAGKLLVAK